MTCIRLKPDLFGVLTQCIAAPVKIIFYYRYRYLAILFLFWNERALTGMFVSCKKCLSFLSSLQGVVRDSGGYAVMLNWTMSNVYGLSPGEVCHNL